MAAQQQILVIDGQAFSRFLIRRELEKRGFLVIAARTEHEADDILTAKDAPTWLIIRDLQNPEVAFRIVSKTSSKAPKSEADKSCYRVHAQLPHPLTAPQLTKNLLQIMDGQSYENSQRRSSERFTKTAILKHCAA